MILRKMYIVHSIAPRAGDLFSLDCVRNVAHMTIGRERTKSMEAFQQHLKLNIRHASLLTFGCELQQRLADRTYSGFYIVHFF
jgi:hypothetical protein